MRGGGKEGEAKRGVGGGDRERGEGEEVRQTERQREVITGTIKTLMNPAYAFFLLQTQKYQCH